MKFVGLFTKIPSYKQFNYSPRHYDPRQEERKEREEKIRREIEAGLRPETQQDLEKHESRIKGSFQTARRQAARQKDPSTALLRTIITLFIVIMLWAYLQFGTTALYGAFLIVPFYLFLKFRKFKR